MQNDLLDIVRRLRSTNSSNAKLEILKKHKDNEPWKQYLYEVYNPFLVYGQSGDKIGGRDDLDNLKLCRSIDAGISITTINKAYPMLIPTKAKIMKAKDKAVDKITYPVYAEIKYDGNYTLIVSSEKTLRFFTSGGHEYQVPDVCFDGDREILVNNPGVYIAERISGDGKLGERRKTSLIGSKQDGQLQWCQDHNRFKIFDYLDFDSYAADKSSKTYIERHRELVDRLDGSDMVVMTSRLENRERLDAYMSGVVAQGYEGLMLKQPDMIWRNSKSRTLTMVKYKLRHTADLLCIAELPGDTAKTQDVIGSLLLRDSEGVEVKVSSGLTDGERTLWGVYKDAVIEIGYEQKMDTYIQPTFIRIRADKTADDID